MECENFLCIYQEDDKCILDKIDLDVQGHCMACIYVEPEKEMLSHLKRKQRRGSY